MTELQVIMKRLVIKREEVYPKTNRNPEYHAYCQAITSLRWLIENGRT